MQIPLWRLLVFTGLVPGIVTAIGAPARIDPMLGPPFTVRERPSLGPAEAAVILIEISDFRCEHCRHFHERVFPRIKRRFVDTGLIRYVLLPAAAPGAAPSPDLFAVAHGALIAGRFWESRAALFAHASERDVSLLARKAGLDPAATQAQLDAPATKSAVARNQLEAVDLKIVGTPTFIVRRRLRSGGFEEARVDGYESWEFFNELLSDLLQREDR